MRWLSVIIMLIVCFLVVSCDKKVWNSPHSLHEYATNTRFASFAEPPKTLDPAKSYSIDEAVFLAQIYEPPLQYHYLKRPYSLEPLTAQSMPEIHYWNKNWQPLPDNSPANKIAYTTYDITIKPNIYYQPHPAFARDKKGRYIFHHLSSVDWLTIKTLNDFSQTGTRELTAADYVYGIKRLASPKINSPILSVMENYIVGLKDYARNLQTVYASQQKISPNNNFLDLRQYPLHGVQVMNKYKYRIILQGKYPQFLYWLAMPFFAPIPWEADYFYSQPGMEENDISWEFYPVGTGPYLLAENNPNQQMVLIRNPNYHSEIYPSEGEKNDHALGYLQDSGKQLPMIDKFIFSLEKESIPRWNKFLQGYYDQSAISSENFDQVVQIDDQGKPRLAPELINKGIRLQVSTEPSIFYLGFNMMDPVVGGYSDSARKLRQAISIAIDYENYINLFLNGRGTIAQGPIPAGIFGYLEGAAGVNPYIYNWENNKPTRKSIDRAKKLLAEAGYPGGRDEKTGRPLMINFDVPAGMSNDKSYFDWLRKQFEQLGIQLNVQNTQYNRFQEKVRTGNAQLFSWGWNADYPDPENFLFLLYGPNGKVKYGGENATNYANPEFDSLFLQMKDMPNNAKRLAIIHKMLDIVRRDSPWIWGVNPQNFVLIHQWLGPMKPNSMANNILKYQRVDPQLRIKAIQEWNKPIVWPFLLMLFALMLLLIPIIIHYRVKIYKPKILSKLNK